MVVSIMNYGRGEVSQSLLEAAHPEIYLRNAFRVLGLSVEATPREISQQAQKIQMIQKYNLKTTLKTPLALHPPPDEHAIREAVHKLHDPEKRLIDEFFWFWPHQLGQSKTDKALALLTENDIDGAAEHWHQMEQSSEAYVSMHNLAVLFHCLALDLEQVALSRELDQKELKTLEKYWTYAFKRWKVVLDHDPFWSRLTARIRALKDPRLTTGLARRIRESLPLALLSINAALAVRHAEAGNLKAAGRQLEIMGLWEDSVGKAGPPPSALIGPLGQKALKEACEPIRQRIKFICKNAENKTERDPTQGAENVRELIAQTKPLLAILDFLLSQGNALRDAAHDEVAVCARHCQIAYANETENWKVSLELLALAFPIAVSQSVRDRIGQDIEIVKRNLEYSTCWFCKQNPAADKAVLEVKMFREVNRIPVIGEGVVITWRHGSIKVPRCLECKKAHSTKGFAIVGAIVGALVGTAIFPIIGTVLGYWIGNLIGKQIDAANMPEGVRPESAKKEFPSVKQLLSEGWKFGERPKW